MSMNHRYALIRIMEGNVAVNCNDSVLISVVFLDVFRSEQQKQEHVLSCDNNQEVHYRYGYYHCWVIYAL